MSYFPEYPKAGFYGLGQSPEYTTAENAMSMFNTGLEMLEEDMLKAIRAYQAGHTPSYGLLKSLASTQRDDIELMPGISDRDRANMISMANAIEDTARNRNISGVIAFSQDLIDKAKSVTAFTPRVNLTEELHGFYLKLMKEVANDFRGVIIPKLQRLSNEARDRGWLSGAAEIAYAGAVGDVFSRNLQGVEVDFLRAANKLQAVPMDYPGHARLMATIEEAKASYDQARDNVMKMPALMDVMWIVADLIDHVAQGVALLARTGLGIMAAVPPWLWAVGIAGIGGLFLLGKVKKTTRTALA